jgi:DNA invertase Pin-like site-specific DNA recombinase
MAVFGYVRLSPLTGDASPDPQNAEITQAAEELGGSLSRVFVDPGFDGKRTAILSRPAGKEMLAAVHAGDTVVVAQLNRLGHSGPDVRATLRALCDREVRIYVVKGLHGQPMDLPPNVTNVLLHAHTVMAKTDTSLRSERSIEAVQLRRERKLPCGAAPYARKIVAENGIKRLEWDTQQLCIIIEIAERLGNGESPEQILVNLWRRRVKDQRGQPWGRPVTRDGSTPKSGFTRRLYHAVRWLHDAKRKGELPSPYDAIALTLPVCKIGPRPGFSRGSGRR